MNLQAFDPQAAHEEKLIVCPSYTRTVSPSVPPCSASGGATDFFPASALRHHQALRPGGGEDARCVRSTSATHTKTCTRTSCVPGSSRHFRGGDAPRSLRLRTAGPGDRTFHDVRDRFGLDRVRHGPHEECLTASVMSAGVVFPRRRTDQTSDTPVAPRSRPHASPAFAGAACPGRDVGFWPRCTGRRMRALRRDHP